MKYLKIVSYLYLAVAVFFVVDAVLKIQAKEDPVISFVFAAIAVFMFFFRMRFAKKQEKLRKDT
jgi:type IV secretory pathway TrbD component